FFFQAEDGIRDGHVTGVQTCALPIFAFPVGDKSFTLPPGRSSRTYEGSPAVAGTIVGLGGHMHDYGRVIEFADVTAGAVIYHAEIGRASCRERCRSRGAKCP